MRIREYCRTHRRKVIIIAMALVMVLGIAGVMTFLFLRENRDNSTSFGKGNFMAREGFAKGKMVRASGITSVGITQESFEVEGITEGLLVEEVYVSSGEELQEGDAILKLSEDSVATVRKELEEVLRDAELAYRAGTIEYEQNKITIQYDRDMAALEGQQAQEIYDETIKALSGNVEKAKEALDDANKQIEEYWEIVDGEDYYETFKVGKYKELYDDNLKLLMTRMEEWGATWSQVVTSSGQMGSLSGGDGSGMPNARGISDSASGSDSGDAPATASSEQLTVLQALYRVLEQNLSDYEQAQEDYEDAVSKAQLNLQTLELSLSSLQESLYEAQADYETQVLQAKLTLEKSLAAAERADSDYETSLEKAKSDYKTLLEAKEDAEKNLELFESEVGDGYYYAAQNGTILRVMVEEEQYLYSESIIFAYTAPEKMTVTVSVEQADIAQISVGEDAYVESSEYGNFAGVVTEINPVSRSDSRTSVTYDVTVELTGDLSKLQSNETVTVTFGLGGNADEEKD